MTFGLLVAISLISSIVASTNTTFNTHSCSASYNAPFDISSTKLLTASSVVFPGGTYYMQPCGSVDVALCPYSTGSQQCFATTTWEEVSDGLGESSAAQWSAVNPNDWTKGIVSINTDISYDYDQCNADPATNSFKTTYICDKGDDSFTVITEPNSSKNAPCIFEFVVDSSVVCAYQNEMKSSSSGGHHSMSSSSSVHVPACHSPSYKAPFDLSVTTTLSASSIVFPGGNYYLHPCGAVDVTLCPYSSGTQQCFATTTWEKVSDGLGESSAAQWSAVNPNDWTKGIVSINTDISYDYDQCNADPATNSFKTIYICGKGDDSITVITEPDASKGGPCIFEFIVDSSVVCAYSQGVRVDMIHPDVTDPGHMSSSLHYWLIALMLVFVFVAGLIFVLMRHIKAKRIKSSQEMAGALHCSVVDVHVEDVNNMIYDRLL